MRAPSKTILRVAAGFQVVVALAAVFGFLQGARYVEFALRRGVEATAAQAVFEWGKYLHLLADTMPKTSSPETAHLLTIPAFDRVELLRTAPASESQGQPLPGLRDGIETWWEKGFSGGLSGVATVRAAPGCRACHPDFAPGEAVGVLKFHVETGFLTKLLASRKANLAALVAAVFAVTSASLWGLALFGFRHQRGIEEAMVEAHEALRASEERYRTLVEHSLVGVYLIQGDRVLYCNRRAAEMFGYSVEEVTQEKSLWDLIAPEDHALVTENLRKRFEGEVDAMRYTVTAVRKDGSRFRAEVFGARTVLPTGPAVLGMIVDNTAVEQARTLMENAYRAVVALPGENPFQAAASSLASFLDVPVAFVTEIAGDSLKVLGSYGPVHGEELPFGGTPCARVAAEKTLQELPRGFVEAYGVPSFVDLVPEAYCGLPLPASSGEVLGVLAVLDARPRSLTALERQIMEIYAVRLGRELERIQLVRQRRELETRLAASEKLAALGELAGGIAHDFNNLLAGILAEAEGLQRRLPPDKAAMVSRVVELAQRGGEVVRRILAFARPGVAKAMPVSASQLIEDCVELVRHTFGPQWRWETQVQPGLYVSGEEALLQQVLLNLLTNAKDALPDGGQVAVRAYQQDAQVVLEVEDRGVGIAPEHLPRVFEPFFTTKPRGQGTGLGLTMAFRTVEAHGGTIHLDSKIGEGTRVTVRLPAAEGPAGPGRETKPAAEGTRRGCRVLLVDDEQAVLEGLEELLGMEGFAVVTASSAEEALAVFQPGAFDVAVVDVLLPGASGIALAQKLIASDPRLALVFASGHTPEVLPKELASRPRVMFLQKPFSVTVLLQTLERVLSQT